MGIFVPLPLSPLPRGPRGPAGVTYSPRAVPSLPQDLGQGGLVQGEAAD